MIEQVSLMKQLTSYLALPPLVLAGFLAGCGGSNDDEAGSPTEFSVVPTTVTFTAPAGTPADTCVAGGTQTVFIYGGSAPYRLDNTVPDAVSLSKSQVGDRGGSFAITVTQPICLKTVIISVLDARGFIVPFTINNEAAATATSPPASAP